LEEPEPYVTPKLLARAVNLAIYLKRPLLLEGEAGCGKTRLARAVAYELGLPFYPWYINSRTRLEDGLYSFDAIGRLHDAQIRSRGEISTSRNPEKPEEYLKKDRPLGMAFELKEYPAVVLIDEIDKANTDFANDLLTALDDDYKYQIPETGQTISAKQKPIIIITSNREKGDLPEPFLRRCLYFYVKFPDRAALEEIVKKHLKTKKSSPESKLLAPAVDRFFDARQSARAKKPGTSEFLDWVKALYGFEGKPLDPSALAEGQPLPFPETLFKTKEDLEHHTG
jgi:MoxR-like ATPase